jgi:glucoamylase
MGATIPFAHRSCGYVGTSDGWTDLADTFHLDREFDAAEDSNIALIGELDRAGPAATWEPNAPSWV